jgi:hypothetical protein
LTTIHLYQSTDREIKPIVLLHVAADIMYESCLKTIDSISGALGLLRAEAQVKPGVNPHGYAGGKSASSSSSDGARDKKEQVEYSETAWPDEKKERRRE